MPDLRPLPLLAAGLGILAASTIPPALLLASAPAHQMLIAPMMAVADTCVLLKAGQVASAGLASACTEGKRASASQMIVESLHDLAPPDKPLAKGYKLGYTLPLPLLSLYEQDNGGQWTINAELVTRYVNTLEDTPYEAVLYLFSNHFSSNVPAEKHLAQDLDNLAFSPNGAIPVSLYFGTPLYPWSVAKTNNTITQFRTQAIDAVAKEICQRDPSILKKIHGITLLGETQQIFPNFENAPGFASPYLVSDYSPSSTVQFRHYLKEKFQTLGRLNDTLGSNYADWNELEPPAKNLSASAVSDIDAHRLSHFDAYADGRIPVMGWIYAGNQEKQASSKILVHLGDQVVASTPINLARPDVLQVHPEFGDNTLGWQTYVDFRHLPSGTHRLQVSLQRTPLEAPIVLAQKSITVSNLHAAWQQPERPLLQPVHASTKIKHHIDLPLENGIYVYNPLSAYWNDFRQEQVVQYLRHFSRAIDTTCLNKTPLFLHQIIPHTNPGWDPQKFAIQKTLTPQPRLQLGISLYGKPGLSNAFIQDIKSQGHKTYGVTEFHPLKGLNNKEMRDTLALHRDNNASFFSFFIEPRWGQAQIVRENNPFAFTATNPFMGSNINYQSFKTFINSDQ